MKGISKFSDLAKIIEEDGVAYSASAWHKDMQTRQLKPTSVSIADLMSMGNQHPNDPSSQAGTPLPEPMKSYMYDLGDLFLKVDNLEIKLEHIRTNPLVQDSSDHKAALREVIAKLRRIKAEIKDIGFTFDDLLA